MERLPTILTLLILVSSAVLAAQPVAGQSGLQVKVTSLHATYGPEGWKDQNATLGAALKGAPVPSLPAGGLGVYQNPYSSFPPHEAPGINYLGYSLATVVSLEDASGHPIQDGGNYVIGATLASAAGSVPVKLTKLGSAKFLVQADLDGENGRSFPALTDGGDATLQVTAYRIPQDPTVDPQQVGTLTRTLHLHRGGLTPSGILFPEAQLPGYDDVGATNFSVLRTALAAPDAKIQASLTFPGAARAPVALQLVDGTTVTTIKNATTDANGSISATFQPSLALNGTSTGLLILEGHLRGDAAGELGSTAVVLPVSPYHMEVSGISYQHRSTPNGSLSANASTVQVTVSDPSAGPNNDSKMGTLDLLSGINVFYNTSFSPQGFLPGQPRSATFQGTVIANRHLASYQILGFFLDGQNRFYSLAQAARGASASAANVQVKPSAASDLKIQVQNLDDNGNGKADPGLLLEAQVLVTGLPGGGNVTREVSVPEGGSTTVTVPFVAPDSGSHTVHVTVQAGEMTLHLSPVVKVASATGPLGLPTSLNNVPGPGIAGLLAALGAALIVVGLRRR